MEEPVTTPTPIPVPETPQTPEAPAPPPAFETGIVLVMPQGGGAVQIHQLNNNVERPATDQDVRALCHGALAWVSGQDVLYAIEQKQVAIVEAQRNAAIKQQLVGGNGSFLGGVGRMLRRRRG